MSKKESNNKKDNYNWEDIKEHLEKELGPHMDAEKIVQHIRESEHIYNTDGKIHEEWKTPDTISDIFRIHSGGGM